MKTKDNKIDNLFRDRLDGFEIEPSAEAGAMMDRLMTGRHNRVLSIRLAVAASIVLIATAGIVLSRVLNHSGKDSLMGSVSLNSKTAAIEPGKDSVINIPVPASNPAGSHDKTSRKNFARVINRKQESPLKKNDAGTEQEMTSGDVRTAVPEILDNKFMTFNPDNTLNNPYPPVTGTEKVRQAGQKSPVIIEYIADQSTPKKGSKTQLVEGIVNRAREIGKDVNLGEIRDLKDQLFALDFIKSKRENKDSK